MPAGQMMVDEVFVAVPNLRMLHPRINLVKPPQHIADLINHVRAPLTLSKFKYSAADSEAIPTP